MSPTVPQQRESGSEDGARVVRPRCFERGDAELASLARGGDESATRALLARHTPRMARLVASALGADPDADDVLQNAVEHLLRALPSLRQPERFGALAHAIVTTTVRKHLRTRRRRRWLVFWKDEHEVEPEAPVANDEVLQAVRALYRLLDEVPPRERIVFCLRHVEGMMLEEVARAEGISLATCKRWLARAEAKIGELGGQNPDLARFAGGSP